MLFLNLLKQVKDAKHDMAKVVIEKIRCNVDGITEAVRSTEVEQKWTTAADEIKQLNENIVKCVKDHPHNILEANK